MRRKLSKLAAALSLLLFVAVVALWVRSHWATDWVQWDGARTRAFIVSSRGDCVLDWISFAFPKPREGWQHIHQEPYDLHGQWRRWAEQRQDIPGLITWGRRNAAGSRSFTILLPYWLMCFVCLTPLAMSAAVRLRRYRRRRTGRCPACGYDLRASPERCPECGEAPPAPGLVRCTEGGAAPRRQTAQ